MPQETGYGESIDRFLARLPSLWQQGEARPTHKARVRPPRHWRTRKALRTRVVRRAAVVAEGPRYQRQGSAGKITRGLSGPVRRCSSANAAAQSEGLAWRHGQETGLRRI